MISLPSIPVDLWDDLGLWVLVPLGIIYRWVERRQETRLLESNSDMGVSTIPRESLPGVASVELFAARVSGLAFYLFIYMLIVNVVQPEVQSITRWYRRERQLLIAQLAAAAADQGATQIVELRIQSGRKGRFRPRSVLWATGTGIIDGPYPVKGGAHHRLDHQCLELTEQRSR